MVKMNRKMLGMLVLLGLLITVVILVSGCVEKPAGQIKTSTIADAKDNSGQSLFSILSQYQGKNVSIVTPAEKGLSLRNVKLKEVNADYIVVDMSSKLHVPYTEAWETIPISSISGIYVATGTYQGTKFEEITIQYG